MLYLLDLSIDQKYFFYLGFEDALCTDYITEKFFHYYNRNVVVVVCGGADYDRLLPNVIDASKCSSAADLSKYLQDVAVSKELYTRYLRNKDRYMVNRWPSYVASFCNICEKLHNIESNRKSYNDHVTFWKKQHV